jgi:acetate---CoA ligase (ADP-forming)
MIAGLVSRDLRPLFDPRSVAVVGASDSSAKWGGAVASSLLAGGEGRRRVYLVNRRARQVLGQRSYPSLAEVPERPELVIVAVPAASFEEVVDDALRAGARALVGLTAGLGEYSADGGEVERRISARVRDAGAAMLGPNCMGVLDTSSGLDAAPWVNLPAGEIALVSQSGNLTFDLADRARTLGIGFCRFASLGNQADLEVADVVAGCAAHEATRLIAVYCEDFRDGRAFAEAALEARRAGKPVLLLAPGRTEAGARAARSHTGSLATDPAVIDAVCRAAGAVAVHTSRELMELACAFLRLPARAGRRVGVITTGGGNGVIAADVLSSAGLEVPALSARLQGQMEAEHPNSGSRANPVDVVGALLERPEALARIARLLLSSREVDMVVVTGSPLAMWEGTAPALARAEVESVPVYREVAAGGRPMVLVTDRLDPPAVRAAIESGIVVYRDIESAAVALARLADFAERPPEGVPVVDVDPLPALTDAGYWEARGALQGAGIAFPPARLVEEVSDALGAADEIGYPVALKVSGLVHKSDAGGVRLGLSDPAALGSAFAELHASFGPGRYTVEQMVDREAGIELILGCRRDLRFGPVALAGLGGIHAELLGDVRLALAPLDEAAAERLIRGLRGAALLLGHRGRPRCDVAAAARALVALSRFAAGHPEIAEVEVNPLLAGPGGAVGLDARIVLARGEAVE